MPDPNIVGDLVLSACRALHLAHVDHSMSTEERKLNLAILTTNIVA